MPAKVTLVIDCSDPDRLADFWTEALSYRRFGSAGQYRSIVPPSGSEGPKLIFQAVAEPKTIKNRCHIDLDADDIEAEAQRLAGLGARRLRPEPIEEHGERWIVMADPEGNEFCVCRS